jgi:uncharacterized protein (TIGR03067 family)
MTPLFLGLALAVAAPAPKEAPKKDAPTLVGVWKVESSIKGGQRSNPEDWTMEFTADGKMIMKEAGRDINGTYTSDPKKDPAEIDLTLEGGGQMITMHGIYRFEGDTMMMCLTFMGERPTKFESPDGGNCVLVTFKRAKKD